MNVALATQSKTEHSLRIERLIAAPPERIFAYWTQAELVAQWLAPGEMRCIDNAVDLRAGGAWHVTMLRTDGSTNTVGGTYLAIEPPRRLVFTWGNSDPACSGVVADTEVEILISEAHGGTRLVLTHTKFSSVESRDRHEMGWGMCLDKLESAAR
jgi:uncharacterized protein YndB with AHSA1/START domain